MPQPVAFRVSEESPPTAKPESRRARIWRRVRTVTVWTAGLAGAAGVGYVSGDKQGAVRAAIGYVTGQPTAEVQAAGAALFRAKARLHETNSYNPAGPGDDSQGAMPTSPGSHPTP